MARRFGTARGSTPDTATDTVGTRADDPLSPALVDTPYRQRLSATLTTVAVLSFAAA